MESMALETPPPYSIAASASTYGSISGFPLGYFLIRSLATGRVLDVDSNELSDSAEVVLWEEKEKSLVEGKRYIRSMSPNPLTSFFATVLSVGMRDRGADNQAGLFL